MFDANTSALGALIIAGSGLLLELVKYFVTQMGKSSRKAVDDAVAMSQMTDDVEKARNIARYYRAKYIKTRKALHKERRLRLELDQRVQTTLHELSTERDHGAIVSRLQQLRSRNTPPKLEA